MTKILVTAIGGDIAQGAATVLRQAFPDWTILGCDSGDRHGGSLYADALFRAPNASDPQYTAWLSELVSRERIDLCLPMSEAELLRLAETDPDTPVRLLWAGQRAIRVGTDKLATSRFIRQLGLPGPWTIASADAEGAPAFPCIFKLRRGSGSKAVFLCSDAQDAMLLRDRFPDSVLQEFLPEADQEVTCAVFRDSSGKVATLQLLRQLVGGMTSWAEVISDPAVDDQCAAIATNLDVVGAINIQLRIGPKGPRIFEINPRLSSTLLMRHIAGFSDLVWMVENMMGKDVTPKLPEPGTVLVRTYGAALIQKKVS
jgi:carbamoyl-phosphate synthase large subunit